MRLSNRARHAVRLMIEICRRSGGDKPVSLGEVSRVTNISRGFLEQIAMALKSHGLIRGVCGKKGGYLPGRPAEQITIRAVLAAIAGDVQLAVCTSTPPECMAADFCECRLLWTLLQKRIEHVLDEYTIADMIKQEGIERLRAELASSTEAHAV